MLITLLLVQSLAFGAADMAVDTLTETALAASRSKAAAKVAEGMKALEKHRTAAARKSATALRHDPLFKDYSLYIDALADRLDAEKKLSSKKGIEARKLAEASASKLSKIELAQPYSPLIKSVADEIGAAELVEGSAHHARKAWKAAQLSFENAFQRFATSGNINLLRPEPIAQYAEACAKKPRPLCDVWAQRIARVYPKSSQEIHALAKYLPESSQRLRPTESFVSTTQSYPAPSLDNAVFEEAMHAFQSNEYGDAIDAFEQLFKEYPKTRLKTRALFWLAKAYELKGKHDMARATEEQVMSDAPLTYYGLLASLLRGTPIERYLSTKTPLASATDPLLTPLETIRLHRAENFLAEKSPDLAAEELREIRSRSALSSPFLTYLAALHSRAGSHLGAFIILGELIHRGHEGIEGWYGVRAIFPKSHLDLIQAAAHEQQLDPVLALSLIKQESAFESKANSRAGAAGMMQLMHATALDMDSGLSRADLLIPSTNIRVGTKYLRLMLDRFDGNIVLALAAYNAGPGAVNRWIRDSGRDKGMLEFIEKIPYDETREYVSSIIRNYFWYTQQLGIGPFRGLEYFWKDPPPPAAKKSS